MQTDKQEGREYLCPRCGRVAAGWPLVRPDTCSPKDWARCLRDPQPDWELVAP